MFENQPIILDFVNFKPRPQDQPDAIIFGGGTVGYLGEYRDFTFTVDKNRNITLQIKPTIATVDFYSTPLCLLEHGLWVFDELNTGYISIGSVNRLLREAFEKVGS